MPDPRPRSTDVALAGADDVRLMTKVARLYHEQGLRQPAIAERLSISQPRVSRLLKRAVALGIVRTTVVAPRGVHAALEDALETRYGLREAVVADTGETEGEAGVAAALGSTAAGYLETTLVDGDRIGISSWSSTLLGTVDRMRPRVGRPLEAVVQVLGGLGTAGAQAHATRLTGRLAVLTGAQPHYLAAPGLVDEAETRAALEGEASIRATMSFYDRLSVLLVGIGSLAPSHLLEASGNSVGGADADALRASGAVGDVCMRFFDAHGAPVVTGVDARVVGIGAGDLRAVPRRIGVAGGVRKREAVRAAVAGAWVNVLVTDYLTALHLAEA